MRARLALGSRGPTRPGGSALAGVPAHVSQAHAGGCRDHGPSVRGWLRAGVDGRARGRERQRRVPLRWTRLRGRHVRANGRLPARPRGQPPTRRRGGRAGAPRVLRGTGRDLPPPRRPCARLRRVRAGAAHSPHRGGAGRLACELLSGRHRRSGRQRRPRALQRLARRREPVLRRGGTGGVKARRSGVLGGRPRPHVGANGVGGTDDHLVSAAQAIALGERVRVLGAREPRGGAAPRERRRTRGRPLGERRVEVRRHGGEPVPRPRRRDRRRSRRRAARSSPAAVGRGGPGYALRRGAAREGYPAPAEAFASSSLLREAMGECLHDCVTYVRREEAEAASGTDEGAQLAAHRWRY